MKRLSLFIVMVIAMLNIACEKHNNGDDFKVVITSESEVKVGKYAEDVTIHYDIHGIEDVKAEVSFSDDSWLRVKEHESDSLVISVAQNDTGAGRMAAVTLSYGGSAATVTINQSAQSSDPIITSLSGEEIEVQRMGTKVLIEYSLENTNPEDYIYAKTNAEWIYSINTDTAATLGN